MSTPLSSSSTYCSVSEFLKRVDKRTVAQLASDTGTPVTDAALLTDPTVAAALADASGMVESACLVSERYTPSDLNTLSGVSSSFLKMLVARLALGCMILRRPSKDAPLPVMYQEALDWLERLRRGERIFGIQETADAGEYESTEITETDLQELNLATYQAARVFGLRGGRNRQ